MGFGEVHAGGIVGGGAFHDEGDVRGGEGAEGLGSAAADFFLDGTCGDEGAGEGGGGEGLHGLDGGGHAGAVVEGLGEEEVRVGHGGEGAVGGDGVAELDAP